MIEPETAAITVIELATAQPRSRHTRIEAGADHRQRRFDRLCSPLRADLFRFALWLTRDRGVAEDVVQETLLRAWTRLDSLQDEESVKPWLLKIVRREAARHYGRKRHETSSLDALIEANDPALAVQDVADSTDVRRAILALEPDYREPLILQVLLGLTTAEIAAVTGIHPGTVLTRLFRARNRLRARLLEGAAQRTVEAGAR